MVGQAKKLVDSLVLEKAKGNKDIENFIRVKLSMKGIPVSSLTESSADDPIVINKIKDVLKEFGANAMKIKSVFSEKKSVAEAAADIKEQLAEFDVTMLVFFASWEAYDHDKISAEMQSAFPNAVVYGCSSHTEICNDKTLTSSVTAMAFSPEVISDVKVEVLEKISDKVDVKSAFKSFDAYFKTPMATADYKEYSGIVLVDSFSAKEEEVMDKIGNQTNIVFVGGSASDALKFDKTYVYANGKAYSDAALLAVFKTKKGVDYIKTQSFDVTDTKLTVTKADPKRRAVIEFDHKPAAVRYAEALEIDRSEIDSEFFAAPVGMVVDNDVYIRSCLRADGDTMIFHCGMMEGMNLKICKIRNIIPDTKKAVEDKAKELGSIAGIVDFRCVRRTIQMTDENTLDDYAAIFNGIPTIGFSTYGEEFLGHINQTSTMLVFK